MIVRDVIDGEFILLDRSVPKHQVLADICVEWAPEVFSNENDGSPVAYARRGAERTLFSATIVLAILFVLANVLALLLG